MVEVKKYYLPPTPLVPNSPYPLLHYRGLLANAKDRSPVQVYDLFAENGWQVQWIFRYGSTQLSHYHSRTHECMAVLTGHARIRFGVADTTDDLEENTHGSAWEDGAIEIEAEAGDIFILPAGLAHKTYDTKPDDEFKLLTPGDGHGIPPGVDARTALSEIQLSGYTMIGAYPKDGSEWDFITTVGAENKKDEFDRVWAVPKPKFDPVLGASAEGLCGQW